MNHLTVGDYAPDFTLPNHEGVLLTLSEIYREQNVLLVLNLGFVWPHCTHHMAQLRHDYQKFKALNTEVMVIVPNGPRLIDKHVKENTPPYPILSDKGARVAELYGVETKRIVFVDAFKPSVFVVDRMGKIRYTNYLTSYIQEPDNNEPLALLAQWASA